VELYTTARIFFGGDTRFSGNAMAKGDVEIYDNAIIENKSIIISTGGTNQKPAPPGPPGGAPPNPVNNPNDIKTFSIYVRDRALVDGILIALDNLAGIKVEKEAFVKGILWAEKSRVAVTGKVHGIVKAFVLVDEQDAVNVAGNVITGTIKELPTIGEYYLPYFFGNSSLISWKEE
jgi:hypothetical protein